jgi:hypothetical protein
MQSKNSNSTGKSSSKIFDNRIALTWQHIPEVFSFYPHGYKNLKTCTTLYQLQQNAKFQATHNAHDPTSLWFLSLLLKRYFDITEMYRS